MSEDWLTFDVILNYSCGYLFWEIEMISEDWYTFDVMFITASGKCFGEIALASDEWLTLDVIVITVSGKCFGEIALMSEDATRNASIIADEETDLLVIHRDLFNSTIKVD